MPRYLEVDWVLGCLAGVKAKRLRLISKPDLSLVAFVEVRLRDTTEAAIREFNEAVLRVNEVEQKNNKDTQRTI